jgi:uncharacterized protein YaiL (DUF2058 family)
LLKSGLVKKLKAEAPAREQSRNPRPPQNKPPQHAKPAHGGAQKGRPQQSGAQPRGAHAAQSAHAQRPGSAEPNLAHAYALRAKQEKDEREAAQREIERVAREKRERKQKLTDLLNGEALNSNDADTPRHFPHGNKIRRVYCTAAQLVELNRGDLGVVQLAGRYLLVAKDVALQAQAIEQQALVLLCDPNAPPEDDVPADLVW